MGTNWSASSAETSGSTFGVIVVTYYCFLLSMMWPLPQESVNSAASWAVKGVKVKPFGWHRSPMTLSTVK
jgi:hypothetical protein